MNPFRRDSSPRAEIRAEAPSVKEADGVATLRLYDPIDSYGGYWGVSAKEFAKALDELPDDTTEIRLLVNSPGGEVYEGLAILNQLRAHRAKVVAVVEGIAASAAAFISTGLDELQMMPNSELMIHRAWGLGIGNKDDFTKLAADLDHIDANQARIFAAKAGGTADDWLAAMSAETWYSAEEAVTAGLADSVVSQGDGEAAKAKARARFDLSVFAHASREDAPEPFIPAAHAAHSAPAAASADGNKETPKEGSVTVAFSDESTTTLRQKLGVSEDADEATILAALDEALEERSDPQVNTDEAPAVVEPYKAEIQRQSEQIAQLVKDNAARAKAEFFDSLVGDGKLKPADRPTWEARYEEAPGVTKDILGARAKGSEVPLAEIGFAAGEDTAAPSDDSYPDSFLTSGQRARLASRAN